MEALQTGQVRPEGIDLTYVSIQSPPEIFARMIRKHSFDLAEMSMSMYMQARAKGNFPFIALPVFPVRLFRHGYIFINKNSGIKSAQDLNGKRIGVPEYRQTAAVWIRGLLQHEHGVDLDSIHWFEGGMNAAREQNSLDIRPPGPLKIDFVSETTLNQMLIDGELDAVIGARRPAAMGVHLSADAYDRDSRGAAGGQAVDRGEHVQGLRAGEGLVPGADALQRHQSLHAAVAVR
jgi:4,5-dihydroxyphthalate decarboxylase